MPKDDHRHARLPGAELGTGFTAKGPLVVRRPAGIVERGFQGVIAVNPVRVTILDTGLAPLGWQLGLKGSH